MAFTRKALEAMEIDAAKIEQIMQLHVEVTDALKAERDQYKDKADKYPAMEKELGELKAKASGDFEKKYNDEHSAFEAYKAKVAGEAALTEKRGLYTELLKGLGIDESRIPAILKVTDFETMAVKEGKLDGSDKLTETAKAEWAGFITAPGKQGAPVPQPGKNNPPTGKEAWEAMSLSAKMQYANEHPAEAAELMRKA